MPSILLMALALAGSAEGDLVRKYPGDWSLFRNADNCAVMGAYEPGVYFRIAYYPRPDNVVLTFNNPAFKGVVTGKAYRLHLMFARGSDLDTHWGVVEGVGADLGSLGGGYFITLPPAVLDDLTKDDFVGLTDDEKPLNKLTIDQLAAPIEGMKACARALTPVKPVAPAS